VADAIVVGFDPQSAQEVAEVERIHRIMVEHARVRSDAAQRSRPMGSGGLRFSAYVPMQLSSSQLEELRRIMQLLHRFLETVGSGETISDPIEPQECNYQLMLELGRACPGLLPMAPIAFAPLHESPAIETRVRRFRLDQLSPRERTVAVAMVDGRSRPEIAKELGVSINTVASIGKRVYAKLGVRRRAQLAARATVLHRMIPRHRTGLRGAGSLSHCILGPSLPNCGGMTPPSGRCPAVFRELLGLQTLKS
jgi:DNA-binding CsgD family transcriptional regulator